MIDASMWSPRRAAAAQQVLRGLEAVHRGLRSPAARPAPRPRRGSRAAAGPAPRRRWPAPARRARRADESPPRSAGAARPRRAPPAAAAAPATAASARAATVASASTSASARSASPAGQRHFRQPAAGPAAPPRASSRLCVHQTLPDSTAPRGIAQPGGRQRGGIERGGAALAAARQPASWPPRSPARAALSTPVLDSTRARAAIIACSSCAGGRRRARGASCWRDCMSAMRSVVIGWVRRYGKAAVVVQPRGLLQLVEHRRRSPAARSRPASSRRSRRGRPRAPCRARN